MIRLLVLLWIIGVPGLALAGGPDRQWNQVTVEVTGIASSHSIDPVTLTRLLAWRKGALCGAHGYGFSIGRIVSGKLYDPGYPNRPVGTNHLDVVLIDDALEAWRKHGGQGARGIWKLTELPDGQYVVSDVEHTPLKIPDAPGDARPSASIEQDLRSGEPERQVHALEMMEQRACFHLIPALIDLLDSQAHVSVTNQGPRGRQFTRKVAMREMAGNALAGITQPLAGRDGPRGASIDVWEEWWKGLLATDPFPVMEIEPGEVTQVARLAMNQTHPEMSVSPSGDRVVVSVSRLERPEQGVRSGIRLIEPGKPREDDFVYKLRDCEPEDLAVGWDGDSIGLTWQECRHAPKGGRVRFMPLDTAGRNGRPVTLKLRRVEHLAIAPFKPGRWLLAAGINPVADQYGDYEAWKRVISLLVLDAKGRVVRRIPKMRLPKNPKCGANEGIVVSAVARTPRGPVLAIHESCEGLALVLLDWRLKTRRAVWVNDPDKDGHGFSPGLAVSGEKLCVAWIESDNYGDRLFARTFDVDGKPLSDVLQLSTAVGTMAGPIPAGDGFVVAWTDFAQTRNQVRIATVPAGVKPGTSRLLQISRDWISGLGAGHANGVTRVFARDTQYYPHWLWFKNIRMGPQ